MTIKHSTKFCAICKKGVGDSAKELPALGAVGSQCYRRYGMLETLLAEHVDAKYYPNQPTANAVAQRFRRAGLKVDIRYRGEDPETGKDRYALIFKGRANQTKSATTKFGMTFAEYRAKLETHLKAKAEERAAERLGKMEQDAAERSAARAASTTVVTQPSLQLGAL